MYRCVLTSVFYTNKWKLNRNFGKMLVSDNAILYTLSRMIGRRFMAVGSTYGVTSWNQLVSEIKSAIWCSFVSDITF